MGAYLGGFIGYVHLVLIVVLDLFNIAVLVSLIRCSYPVKVPTVIIGILQYLFLSVLVLVAAVIEVESGFQLLFFSSIVPLVDQGH